MATLFFTESREVRLYLGPMDGGVGFASHDVTHAGDPLETYVYDGSEDRNSFIHAHSAIARLPLEERMIEEHLFATYVRERTEWELLILTPDSQGHLPTPTPPPVPPAAIPYWRLTAWWELHRTGRLYF